MKELGSVSKVVGIAIVLAFAWAGFTGWHPMSEPRGFVPASVRSSPGGYRSFHFWHSGWQGGK